MLVSRQTSISSNSSVISTPNSNQTAVMFILAALNKILADKDTKRSHNAQLRASCEAALKEIQELVGAETPSDSDNVSISSVLPEPFQEAAKLDADKYFLPFRFCHEMIYLRAEYIWPGLTSAWLVRARPHAWLSSLWTEFRNWSPTVI